MDLKQIEYILKIAEENNITRAAEKLFITQSALNQQLLKLEKELDTPLFYRSRTNWRPTEAGEVYIRNAKEMLRIRKTTYDQIRDIARTQKGTLTLGITPGRGIALFGGVYPIFHQKYPYITVEPVEQNVRTLQAMIAEGSLDVGFLTLGRQNYTKDEYILLQEEEIVLSIPACHPLSQYAAPPGEPLAVLDLKQAQYEPFVLMDRDSTMRVLINQIFERSGFTPSILFETKNHATIVSLIQSNLCCGLLPYYYIKTNPPGIASFRLPFHPTWDVVASHKKNAYVSEAARYFIELAREFWNS
ncbi:MAG: LysR family transcriptional regulator [Lachnospiraceae bacterium]|nr:LysR family transcriptional regulator [Lachnospiraceae bacterium]